jgi:myosin heavy subunit
VPADQFRYTAEGNAITINGVDDAQQFRETREALTLLGLLPMGAAALVLVLVTVGLSVIA